MQDSSSKRSPRHDLHPAGRGLLVALVLCAAVPAIAWIDLDEIEPNDRYNGTMVVDGSMVMNVGELQINITNHGLIGSQPGSNRQWSDAPSAQWPAGSGVEYLWSAGIWVGGVTGEARVTVSRP